MPPLFPVPDGRLRIADGGLATELQRLGLPLGQPGDPWNLQHADAVRSVAAAYEVAGARVLVTNTFRANPVALAALGAADDLEAINRTGVELARAEIGPRGWVVGSVGPVGPSLSADEIAPHAVLLALAAQCRVLAVAGVDAILLETFTDLAEARLAVAAARTTGRPIIASMSFDAGDGTLTLHGDTPEAVAEALTEAGVDALGVNCGLGPEAALRVAQRLRSASPLPLWFRPNAGLPRMADGRAHYNLPDDALARLLPDLIGLGVAVAGGCCGTTPAHIGTLADAARRLGVVAD